MAKKTIFEWEFELDALFKAGDASDLFSRANICINAYPNESIGYHYRGLANENLEKHEEAVEDYSKAIELDPNDAKAYNSRGAAKNNLKLYEEAIKDYDKALELDPNYADAYNNRGIANVKLGLYQEAIEDYDKAIDLEPKSANAYNNRANVKGKLGQHEDAIKDFNKAIELEPGNTGFHHNRALEYGKIEVEKTSAKVEEAYKENLANITDPNEIIKFYRDEIDRTRIRLYGNLENIGDIEEAKRQNFDDFHKNDGLKGKADKAYSHYRVFMLIIWFAVASLFYFYFGAPDEAIRPQDAWLIIIPVTVTVLLLSAPFHLHVRYLARQRDAELVRLHSLMRELIRILFWQAQSPKHEDSDKSNLAPAILENMEKNSTADVSLQMMHPRQFTRKGKSGELSEETSNSLIKKLTTAIEGIKLLPKD